MNREFRAKLRNLRKTMYEVMGELEIIVQQFPEEDEPKEEETFLTDEELEEVPDINWTTADEPAQAGVNFAIMKDLESLKDITIMGQITKVFDLTSYVKKGKVVAPGLIYRFVLTELDKPHNDIVAITFDEMAGELKQHMIGTRLKITKAWKVEKNKHGVIELHLGNFAKVEVIE